MNVIGTDLDNGNPATVRAGVERTFKSLTDLAKQLLAPLWGGYLPEVPASVQQQIAGMLGDDLIGTTTLAATPRLLAEWAPNVGDEHEVPLILEGGDPGDVPFSDGGRYQVVLRVTRVS